METKDIAFKGLTMNGFFMLFVNLILIPLTVVGCVFLLPMQKALAITGIVLLSLIFLIFWGGFIMQEPNEARVMVFFGEYKGTFRKTGYFWVNPFLEAKKLSLRARNLNIDPIKVNDKEGNPILIGLAMVWKLNDTYKALFEIDSETMAKPVEVGNAVAGRMASFENFVRVQSDSALRKAAGMYAYDTNETAEGELTLRDGGDEISKQLEAQLSERLAMAGMEVVEARINYLAYAPEIAAVMLRRQQASAIISAREKIVEGAVSMTKMALDKLESEQIVALDNEKKAALVSNLLVVLCADETAQPVLNV